MQNYNVHLRAMQQQDGVSKKKQAPWATRQETSSAEGYSLGYWCFSPGETKNEFMKSDIRCMILSSRTLSPIKSFKAELQVDIPVENESPHIIPGHQMFVGIVKRGPDATIVNSSDNSRTDARYMNSIEQALVNFSHVVPDGMLFFSLCTVPWRQWRIQRRSK